MVHWRTARALCHPRGWSCEHHNPSSRPLCPNQSLAPTGNAVPGALVPCSGAQTAVARPSLLDLPRDKLQWHHHSNWEWVAAPSSTFLPRLQTPCCHRHLGGRLVVPRSSKAHLAVGHVNASPPAVRKHVASRHRHWHPGGVLNSHPCPRLHSSESHTPDIASNPSHLPLEHMHLEGKKPQDRDPHVEPQPWKSALDEQQPRQKWLLPLEDIPFCNTESRGILTVGGVG
mmetsp:Transcript_41810/g.90613  ORF Transcript_41810/g.90613 Transcript_41810/m.90613 type:complete len:229 (+) Transcript_41810:710-1396(+)